MKYEAEVRIEIEIDEDDTELAYQRVDAIMQQHHDQTGETLGWGYTMLEDCVTNKTREGDTYAQKAVCRYCQREIVDNPDEGWVCPEAEGDDLIWRTSCEDNHVTLAGEHEPDLGLENDMRLIRKHDDQEV